MANLYARFSAAFARAIAESKAQASKRTATIFAPSDLPDYQPRPEVNWGERWELEEALATVPASQSMQLGWPVANWCFPAEQSLQYANPVVLATVPAAQAEQLLAPVASL